ncbi:uncharacterized protein RSE6_08145 [Rhynchosporium secalis]|uniref:Uncharacterized protein n=1 Tax=Rhynchosporium secalis TaxID=38038 RepID=A0A1E1MEP8_RHYSE|nr:uncharacterized protein RSE6_08145 [Rhynchosporium secalis]
MSSSAAQVGYQRKGRQRHTNDETSYSRKHKDLQVLTGKDAQDDLLEGQ